MGGEQSFSRGNLAAFVSLLVNEENLPDSTRSFCDEDVKDEVGGSGGNGEWEQVTMMRRKRSMRSRLVRFKHSFERLVDKNVSHRHNADFHDVDDHVLRV